MIRKSYLVNILLRNGALAYYVNDFTSGEGSVLPADRGCSCSSTTSCVIAYRAQYVKVQQTRDAKRTVQSSISSIYLLPTTIV
jgi:hypothetical protein